MQPQKIHEATIQDLFKVALDEHLAGRATARRESRQSYPGGRTFVHDIVISFDLRRRAVVEVKVPFTNQDGINNKTRRRPHLPKDLDALKAALEAGAPAVYELIVPIGCYPVDEQGEIVVLENAIGRNEKAVKERFGIQWPTRKDYEAKGKKEVDTAYRKSCFRASLGSQADWRLDPY